jgi:hypothetical protein
MRWISAGQTYLFVRYAGAGMLIFRHRRIMAVAD